MFEYAIDADLKLRTLQEKDAEELFQVVDANRQHLREWLPWLDANTERKHTRQYIRSTLDQQARNEGFVCTVLRDHQIIGIAGYHPIDWSIRSVEIGYWLSREAVGNGIMTRCCRVLVDHAFVQLGLNRVTIPVAVENVRSRAVPERLGFQQEGILKNAEWLYDHYVDHVLYAVLKQNWSSKNDHGP